MAYAIPGTVASGDVATAAAWNVITNDVIDHELYVSPIRTGLTSYTPTLAQGASTNISKTINYAAYQVVGKVMYLWIRIFATGVGTAGSAITVSIPSGYTALNTDGYLGSGVYGDSGVGDYPCLVYAQTSTTLSMIAMTTTTGARIGVTPATTVGANDSPNFFAVIPLA